MGFDAGDRTEIMRFALGEEEKFVEEFEGSGGRLMDTCDND